MKTATRNPSDNEAIEAMAAAWLAQRDDGLTPEQETEFARWRQTDLRHEVAVARLDAAWSALQQLKHFRPEARAHPDRDLLARPFVHGRKPVFLPVLAAAAIAAVLAIAALWKWPRSAAPESARVYATTAGGYQRVTLDDGSVIDLNADSEAHVAYTPLVRRVELTRGEAGFTVAKNKERPFLVEAGSVTLRAVGTAFDVRLDSRRVEVLVTEGKVTVENRAPVAAPLSETPVLAAGQRMVIPTDAVASSEPPRVQSVTPEAVRESVAWQETRLRFADTPLAQVVAEFNRRNTVQIVLGDASLATLPVDGSFRPENVEAFVRLITSDGSISVDRPEPSRIVLRRAK